MKKHLFYYVSLTLVLALGFAAPVYFSAQRTVQIIFIMMTAFFYVVWGVAHQIIHHSFSLKIMLEYVAIAVLGISIVLFVLNVAL